MPDIRKLLDIINETTVAGSVATVAAPMGEMQKRVEETATEETKNPEVIEYGMWENSALATTSKLKKNRGKSAKVVKSIYGENVQSEAANPKQQAAIAIAKKKEVAEGKFTINAKTGAKLDPRTGAELPPKEKPLTMKDMFRQPKSTAPKLSLDDVWMKIQSVVSNIYPDGDPIDHLAPWLEKHGIRDFKIGEILDRAAKKNGYKDLYDYYDSMKDQYDRDNVAEAGHQSPHAKLAQLKAKYDAALKSPNPNMTTLRRIRDQIIKLEFDLGLKEGVAEGSEKKDMTGQTCEKCKKDKYKERSWNDDRNGTLQCSCGHVVDRWRKYKKKEQGVAEGLSSDKNMSALQKVVDAASKYGFKMSNRSKNGQKIILHNTDFHQWLTCRIRNINGKIYIDYDESSNNNGLRNEVVSPSEFIQRLKNYYLKGQVWLEKIRKRDAAEKNFVGIRVEQYPYGKPSSGLRAAVKFLNRNGKRGHKYFDFPEYADIPDEISSELMPDEVDFIQDRWDEVPADKQGVAEGSLNEGQYEMMLRNGQVKKFVAKDDADAKRIAKGHGAKSVIRLKGGVPAGKVSEQSMAEGTLEESDLILNPASLSKLSRDLVSHEQDRTDHEVEMAKSDLYQAGKNAVKIFELIKDISEEEGLEGWVQEKIIKANDYLNTIREYLEGKQMESMDGVAPGTKMFTSEEKPGLWANIHAKRKRIKSGSGERMREPGSKGAPSAQDFKDAAK